MHLLNGGFLGKINAGLGQELVQLVGREWVAIYTFDIRGGLLLDVRHV